MTDIANTAAELSIKTLNAAEIVFSMDFVVKLAKKLVKDNPGHTPAQIADAIETVFQAKLALAEKRLQNVEKIRASYNALKSSTEVVADTVALIKKLGDQPSVDYAAQLVSQKVTAPKPVIKKINGAAKPDSNQIGMSL